MVYDEIEKIKRKWIIVIFECNKNHYVIFLKSLQKSYVQKFKDIGDWGKSYNILVKIGIADGDISMLLELNTHKLLRN